MLAAPLIQAEAHPPPGPRGWSTRRAAHCAASIARRPPIDPDNSDTLMAFRSPKAIGLADRPPNALQIRRDKDSSTRSILSKRSRGWLANSTISMTCVDSTDIRFVRSMTGRARSARSLNGSQPDISAYPSGCPIVYEHSRPAPGPASPTGSKQARCQKLLHFHGRHYRKSSHTCACDGSMAARCWPSSKRKSQSASTRLLFIRMRR